MGVGAVACAGGGGMVVVEGEGGVAGLIDRSSAASTFEVRCLLDGRPDPDVADRASVDAEAALTDMLLVKG